MASAKTYDQIAWTSLGSAANSITFSSIAASWTDLRLVVNTPTWSSTGNNMFLQFNGDTATNYSFRHLSGNGTAASSGSNQSVSYIFITNNAFSPAGTSPTTATVDIFSYAGSTYKTVLSTLSFDQNGSGGVNANVSLWRSTAAITSIKVMLNSANFGTGSTFALYGIKAA